MASVRNKSTKPELLVRKAIFNKGYRYRINVTTLPGSPDIVLTKYRTVIFVHGCFWHGHTNCPKAIRANSNVGFWEEKIKKNRKRDQKAKIELRKLGWKIITIWECSLRNNKSLIRVCSKTCIQTWCDFEAGR